MEPLHNCKFPPGPLPRSSTDCQKHPPVSQSRSDQLTAGGTPRSRFSGPTHSQLHMYPNGLHCRCCRIHVFEELSHFLCWAAALQTRTFGAVNCEHLQRGDGLICRHICPASLRPRLLCVGTPASAGVFYRRARVREVDSHSRDDRRAVTANVPHSSSA